MDQRGYRRQPQASVSTLIRTGGLDGAVGAVGPASSSAPHSLSSGSGPLMLAPAELELDASAQLYSASLPGSVGAKQFYACYTCMYVADTMYMCLY